MPSHNVGQIRGHRDADKIGDSHSRNHDCHGFNLFVLGRQPFGDNSGYSEKAAMRQSGYKTCQQHKFISGSKNSHGISDTHQCHQRNKQRFKRFSPCQKNQRQRSDAHAQRIGGDKVSGLGD